VSKADTRVPDPAANARYTRLSALLLLVAGALMYLSFGYTEMAGSDMWWHVAAGRELVQTGSLWMVDDWSYTALSHTWLNHEWLADLVYYGIAAQWGVESLVYWKWLVIVVTFTLLQLALARVSGSHFAGFLCAVGAAAIAAPFLDVRPHLYTLLFFSLLMYLLLRRRPRPLLLALIFVIWVNMHGGFFFGLMALGILLFPWRDLRLGTLRSAALVGLLCAFAAVLNPSGFGTFLYPLKYAFDETSPFRSLAEWLPPNAPGGIRSPLFFVFQWAPLAALLYLLPEVRKRTGLPWEGLALTALTLAMALTSRRFIPIFAISLAVLLAPLFGLGLRALSGRLVAVPVAIVALLLAAWRVLPYPLQAAPAFHYLVAEYSYPVDTLNFMRANDLQGKLFAYYNWGGYVHWRSDGDLKVYIDGRADTLFDADTYLKYVFVLRSRPGWIDVIEADEPDFILWPHARGDGHEKLSALLETGRWRAVHRDGVSWLLARVDYPLPAPPQPAPEGPWRDTSRAYQAARRGDVDSVIAYSRYVRARMPWNRHACRMLHRALTARDGESAARTVLEDCWRYFPSRALL
tara:strand:- start:26290 stop:28017 length:1728 start_codon:yes stop_codon:yes gene_type:complete